MTASVPPPSNKGDWVIEQFEISKTGSACSIFQYGSRRRPPAGTYTRLMRGGKLVMSNTPAEISDYRFFVFQATGDVLIHGLGLGLVANECANKESVRSVTVVEISSDLIDLVKPYLHPKIEVILGDALTYKWPKNTYFDCVWHDIWDDICEDNLSQMSKLHRSWGHRCGYQDSWSRNELKSQS